jgi:hypothetical protein
MIELPDPREQRERVIAQIREWQRRHAKKPSHLLEVQLAALLRLVDRLDDLIDEGRLERQAAAERDDYSPPQGEAAE